MILQIPPNGEGGTGCFPGNMQIQIGRCFAEFEECGRVVAVKVFGDGSMKIRRANSASDWKVILRQRDGFEQDYQGAREIELSSTLLPMSLASSVDISQVK
jgi:hypothetical protein